MSHRTRGLGVVLVALVIAVGCARATRDQRVSEAPPPAVPAPGAVIGSPTGWRTMTEGQAPVPIPGHPPIAASGVIRSFDPGTHIVQFEDGRMVKLIGQSKVVQPAGPDGDVVVLHDVLPVGVQSGAKTLALGRPQRMATVASVDEPSGLVRLTDGTAVRVSSSTNLHRGATGSSTVLTELTPGDEVVIVLAGPDATPAAGDAASALPRQDVSPPVEAAEVMVFRAPR